jgi:hypothetical protein
MRSLGVPEGCASAGRARSVGFKKIDNFLTNRLGPCYCFSESCDKLGLRFSCAKADQSFGFKGWETDSEMAPQAIEIA